MREVATSLHLGSWKEAVSGVQEFLEVVNPECLGRGSKSGYVKFACAIDGSDGTGLTLAQFEEMEMSIFNMDAIGEVFDSNVDEQEMSASQFRAFLGSAQRDVRSNEVLQPIPTLEDTQNVIRSINDDSCEGLKKRTFHKYILSSANDIIDPSHRDVHQDMTKPMSRYFIASSHNTYLVGKQHNDQSSYEIYRQILLSGCRCIELDLWDGKGGEPIITHGGMNTSNIHGFHDPAMRAGTLPARAPAHRGALAVQGARFPLVRRRYRGSRQGASPRSCS